jgi:hypothetical protein
MTLHIKDQRTLLFREDGYVNATKLCKAGKKKFNDWIRLNTTKELIKAFSKNLSLDIEQLVESSEGRYGGTWIHPKLSIHIAQWISSEFVVKVSDWIDEWRLSCNKNEQKYIKSLEDIEPDDRKLDVEKQIQLRLQEELGGEIEVRTDFGYIDLLTDKELIEIKEASNWKHGVGQLLAYSVFYKDRVLRLHLFNTKDIRKDIIDFCCGVHDIIITIE